MPKALARLVCLLLGTLAFLPAFCAEAPGTAADSAGTVPAPVDAETLLQQMTLDEKLALMHGMRDPEPAVGLGTAGYLPGVPRLGIPPLRLTDGPAGIRTLVRTATALPAPVMLAASFDPELARRYGETIGIEGVARNQQVLLSPMVNMVRVPHAGRNFETFGEDPLLASALVTAEIDGIQSKGMMATVKHFAANNQEKDRLTIDAEVDERTLRELYFPAFEAAVNAGVASVMCAYNQVNGAFGCENDYLINTVLRKDWGFKGFVMTDWWARHTLKALDNGLNLEMPGYTHPEYPVDVSFDAPLREAVQSGRIAESKVDDAVRPLLQQMQRFGMLQASPAKPINENVVDNHAAALATAIGGAVLLKNANATLPLSSEDLADTVMFGATALWTLHGGGGSSRVLPSAHDTTLDMLKQLSGQSVAWHPGYDLDGIAIPTEALLLPDKSGKHGLRHTNFAGKLSNVAALDFASDNNKLSGTGMWYWDTELVAPETGRYDLMLQTDGPTASLYHGESRLIFNDGGQLSSATLIPTRSGLRNASTSVELQAGEHYPLRVVIWTGDNNPIRLRLAWLTPSQQQKNIDDAVQAAASARHAVIFAHVEGTEGGDRTTLTLPGYQDALIDAIEQKTNASVTVVLNTGAPVTMPWADNTEAILQMWYPGQAGGEATARLLLGLDNPSGKLPVTFPRNEADTPVHDAVRYPGLDGRQEYSEGLFMGYRWYDKQNITPRFAFGHGLSYTSFEYSDLALSRNGDDVNVSFTVRNSGERAGAEVAQVYLEQGNTGGIDVEVRKLVGFDKVMLQPGASARIALKVPARSFMYWNAGSDAWQPVPGSKAFSVGSSSRDLRLHGTVGAQ